MTSIEIISNISSIVECDAEGLGLILSIGFNTINNCQEAYTELEEREKWVAYFSNPMYDNTKVAIPELKRVFGITPEELSAEIIKRIGRNDSFRYRFRGWWHECGTCSPENAKKILEIVTQEAEEWKIRLDNAEQVFEENRKIVTLIPPDYRYPLALTTMLGFVRNLRASTWKECADLYEEQLHRWQMEENSAENIRLQREIRGLTKRAVDSATTAAVFSGLNFLLK